MKVMFEQVSKRFSTVNKIVSVPNHPISEEEIVQLYADGITPKTKLLMVCHMIPFKILARILDYYAECVYDD